MVLNETTEEGRLFQTGIILVKTKFSGHHYRQIVLCITNLMMPEYVLGLAPGSCNLPLSRVYLVKEG